MNKRIGGSVLIKPRTLMVLPVNHRPAGARIGWQFALFFALPLPLIAVLVSLHYQSSKFWPGPDPARVDTPSAPPAQAITSFGPHPAAVAGGLTAKATVTLRSPAQRGGVVVTLASSDPMSARVPPSVTIPEGQGSATFDISTAKVAAHTTVGLSASHEGKTQTDSLMLLPATRAEWYVAPDGSPRGRGAKDSPWDLATALAQGPGRAEVKPGDTVWLRGGRYAGTFVSTLAGREDAPVVVRALPGERATLDRAGASAEKQPALKVKGSWVWFWGLEITNSHPDRSRESPYTGDDEPWRGSGADVYAPHVKFINCVFHDNGHGIWDKQDGTEVAGCLFYYNGNNKREHALYLGNKEGTKYVTDNVVFAQGGYGILSHSDSARSAQKGLHIEGNVVFNNGVLTLDDQTTGNVQVGGVRGVPAERIVLKNNYVYHPPAASPAKNNGIRLGYEDKGNRDVKLLDNYVVGRDAVRVWWWQSVEFQGNTIYSQGESLELLVPAGVSPSAYLWDSNTYLGGRGRGPVLVLGSGALDFSRWRKATGLDGRSRVVQNESLRPEGVHAFLRPNRYEAGRAHIVVYNWDMRERVAVEVGPALSRGDAYEVRDAQDFFGAPVARGTFDGSPIQLPLTLKKVAPPVGGVERAHLHTAPEFAAFVLLRTRAS